MHGNIIYVCAIVAVKVLGDNLYYNFPATSMAGVNAEWKARFALSEGRGMLSEAFTIYGKILFIFSHHHHHCY
jgi:hypothetical protein